MHHSLIGCVHLVFTDGQNIEWLRQSQAEECAFWARTQFCKLFVARVTIFRKHGLLCCEEKYTLLSLLFLAAAGFERWKEIRP
jgi:hypothetical protein